MDARIYRSALMPEATDLRQRADFYRRLADVPTATAHRADGVLLMLAARLEREADELEGRAREAAAVTHETPKMVLV